MPPAAFICPSPAAPSSPIPVIIIPTESLPYSEATEPNNTSTEGLWLFTGAESFTMTTGPRLVLLTFICLPPGAIMARPGKTISPSRASLTSIADILFRRDAKTSVKPAGMCWTIRSPACMSAGSVGRM